MEATQRIVSLLSSATEILFAIGLGDRVLAVSHECDFPPDIANLPRVTQSRVDAAADSAAIDKQVRDVSASGLPLYEVDAIELGRLQPDLIVTQAQCDVCAVSYQQVMQIVASDSRLSHTRVLALRPEKLEDLFSDIRRVGEAAGVEEAAAKCIERLMQRIESVRARLAITHANRPRTICIEWIEPLMLAANWTPELIKMAGGENGLSVAGQHSSYGSWDQVVEYDPEVILVAPCGFDLARTTVEAQRLTALKGWESLSAVRSLRVFAIDGSAYLNRSGPRLIESLEILAHLFHPGIFPPPRLSQTKPGWKVM